MSLQGRKIAILISPKGTEDPEFAKPKAAVEDAGGMVTVISLQTGEAKTVNNDLDPGSTYPVDKAIYCSPDKSDVSPISLTASPEKFGSPNP